MEVHLISRNSAVIHRVHYAFVEELPALQDSLEPELSTMMRIITKPYVKYSAALAQHSCATGHPRGLRDYHAGLHLDNRSLNLQQCPPELTSPLPSVWPLLTEIEDLQKHVACSPAWIWC